MPNSPKVERKLAAIVFTDIAGFTALSAVDEEKAFELLDLQRSILKPIVKEYSGEWLKEIGDGENVWFSFLLEIQITFISSIYPEESIWSSPYQC